MIDTPRLIACGVHPTQAKTFAPLLAAAANQFDILTVQQQAGFVAQAMHESTDFTALEENLYYSTPERIRQIFASRVASLGDAAKLIKNPQALANVVYADREGNGDTASGDGWKFRGRGLFGLTFTDNYRDAGDALGRDYLAAPELVAQPEDAALTAAWFWSSAGCNGFMANGLFDSTTKRINPGMAGAAERRALYATCQVALR